MKVLTLFICFVLNKLEATREALINNFKHIIYEVDEHVYLM